MKKLLIALGILLLAAPFVMLVFYALTPWEPHRGWAAVIVGFFSLSIGGELLEDLLKEPNQKPNQKPEDRHPWFEKNTDPTYEDRD
jgi:hypothetical protein